MVHGYKDTKDTLPSEDPLQRERRLRTLFDYLRRSRPSEYTKELIEATRIEEQGGGEEDWDWEGFKRYADRKEPELFKLFRALDKNNDGVLEKKEISSSLLQAGIRLEDRAVSDFLDYIDANKDGRIEWIEWRDFLLAVPRRASITEAYRYYRSKREPTSWLTADSDLSVGTLDDEARQHHDPVDRTDDDEEEGSESEGKEGLLSGSQAYLFAGGIAGVASRTLTAPFDRIKIYLITSTEVKHAASTPQMMKGAGRALSRAIDQIYSERGIRGFWVGNALNCVKILPESACRFFTYELAKRYAAAHWDHVSDASQITSTSRFMAGGTAGLVSQFVVYPIETLKTRMMSSTVAAKGMTGTALLLSTTKVMRAEGLQAWWRGLIPACIGVFPFSALDMSIFEALSRGYRRLNVGQDPGPLTNMAFGAFSGGVGAVMVYPLNLVRSRLQAQGSPSHPYRYKGMRDCFVQTLTREGVPGFYRGLGISLAKVIPGMATSWAVYETVKRRALNP